jgi:hypothetical protein
VLHPTAVLMDMVVQTSMGTARRWLASVADWTPASADVLEPLSEKE